MTTPILATKLYTPALRPNLVPRPHLLERLHGGLRHQCKVTLISAPAGFGKTTLVSAWGAACVQPVAWLSLDEADHELPRFLHYLIAALQTLPATVQATTIGAGVLAQLQAPQPPSTAALLTDLLNEIATIADDFILILDDYHLIDAAAVDQALTFLIEHMPPQMHLTIATREDPALPLARLRARGQLTELRAADLRFTAGETADFLNRTMGLALSATEIEALEARTEGWIAGLQLAALSMQGDQDTTRFIKSFAGSHHFILDYLLTEVLEKQPANVQRFLLETAILDRLTGPLCDAVCSDAASTSEERGSTHLTASGQATLELLEHANLFIVPLDNERRWYRYHHLFTDLLRRRLQQHYPERVPTLHLQASRWYEQHGFTDQAIAHALRGEEFERAVHLIERVAEAVWVGGEHTKLRRWLDPLPVDLVRSRPQLAIVHAWSLFAAGEHAAAVRSIDAVEQWLAAHADHTTATSSPHPQVAEERRKLCGRVAVVRAFMAFFQDDVLGIIGYARQALEDLPEQDVNWRTTAAVALGDAYSLRGQPAAALVVQRKTLEESKAIGNIYMVLTAGLKLAVTLRLLGHLQPASELCQQLIQHAQENGIGQSVVVGCLTVMWAELLTEFNQMDRAGALGNQGIALTERGGDVAMLGWSYLCQVRILCSLGDIAAAEAIIQKVERMGHALSVPPWVTNRLAAWQARIWLTQGLLSRVAQWIEAQELDPIDDPTDNSNAELNLQHERAYMVLARLWIAQGQLDDATRLLDRLRQVAAANGRVTVEIETLILQALACEAVGDTAGAVATLEEALVIAEPGGYIRTFVDEGPPVARLLYEALAHNIAPDYVRRLLVAFPIPEPVQTAPSDSQSAMLEPLSERELEVLQLIAEGLTNPEIAARLFLTLNTVKAHTRNIYGKLDVHNRTQAIAKATGLGLLPSRS